MLGYGDYRTKEHIKRGQDQDKSPIQRNEKACKHHIRHDEEQNRVCHAKPSSKGCSMIE